MVVLAPPLSPIRRALLHAGFSPSPPHSVNFSAHFPFATTRYPTRRAASTFVCADERLVCERCHSYYVKPSLLCYVPISSQQKRVRSSVSCCTKRFVTERWSQNSPLGFCESVWLRSGLISECFFHHNQCIIRPFALFA